MAFESDGQPFGGKGAQFNFVRDPQALVAIGRSYLDLLVSHYTDDTYGIEAEEHSRQAWEVWCELHDIIGWRLDRRKSPPPAAQF